MASQDRCISIHGSAYNVYRDYLLHKNIPKTKITRTRHLGFMTESNVKFTDLEGEVGLSMLRKA